MQTQILGLVTPMMALFFAATFAVLWRAGRMKRHVLGFAIAYALFAVGYLITHLLPADAFYLFHTTQVFYTLATVLMLAGCCERAGVRLHLGSIAFVYAVCAVTLGIAISASGDTAPRLLIVNTGYGVITAMAVTTLLTARKRDLFDILIIAAATFSAVDFLVRPVLTLMFEQSIPVAVYRDSIYYSLIGLMLGVKTVITAMVLIGATIAEWTANLRESSERDALSGLRHRGAFEDAVHDMLGRGQAQRKPVSLVVADIDHFKKVNDIWGHQAGDLAIKAFGELIEKTVRGCDVAGRIGGEEFCIAAWNCENEPSKQLAERIRKSFASIKHDGLSDDIRLTASFGVATAQDGEGYETLFARADAVLYQAKAAGRDRVEIARTDAHDNAQSAATDAPHAAVIRAAAG